MRYSQNHLQIIIAETQSQTLDFIAIVGSTCTGKTDLSLALAEYFGVPIINADSRLVFKEMDIGTAKPSINELNQIKHYLVNIKEANQNYSAGEYRKDFDQIYQALEDSEKSPKAIVVGGTGLYINSALGNLEMPEISRDDALRAKLADLELDSLKQIMSDLDPESLDQIDIKNKVRVIRAIELMQKSGKTLSELRSKTDVDRYRVKYFALEFSDREILYSLIDKRVINMIDKGLIDEVKDLKAKYGESQTLNSTIGYKEIIDYLNEKQSLDTAIAEIQKNTRNYAKRQITWFKKNQDIIWLNADENLVSS